MLSSIFCIISQRFRKVCEFLLFSKSVSAILQRQIVENGKISCIRTEISHVIGSKSMVFLCELLANFSRKIYFIT